MALTLLHRLETLAFNATHDLSGGLSAMTLNSAATLSPTGALVGTNSLFANGSAHQARLGSNTTVFDRFTGTLAFVFRVSNWSGGTVIGTVGSGWTSQYGFKLAGNAPNGNIAFYEGDPDGSAHQAVTTAANLQVNTLYGVVGRWDHAANTIRIEVYSDPLGTPTLIEGVSNTTPYTAPASLVSDDGFRIGDMSGLGFTGRFDTLMVSKLFNEPVQENFGINSITEYGEGGEPEPGPAVALAFVSPPASTTVGQTMADVTVRAVNSEGDADPAYVGNVTVALQTGSGTLAGTLTRAAVAGVATFNNLSINTLNTGAVLRATASGLTSADSPPFDIIAGSGGGSGLVRSPIGSAIIV